MRLLTQRLSETPPERRGDLAEEIELVATKLVRTVFRAITDPGAGLLRDLIRRNLVQSLLAIEASRGCPWMASLWGVTLVCRRFLEMAERERPVFLRRGGDADA